MIANLTIETFPNEAAAAYIRGKAVADPTNFGRLPAQLKQRAFTAAGIEQMDVLRRLRDTVAKLPAGSDWDEVKGDTASQLSPFAGGDAKAAAARAERMLCGSTASRPMRSRATSSRCRRRGRSSIGRGTTDGNAPS